MDPHHYEDHISQQFNSELEDLRNRVLSMGGVVEQQLSDALWAFSAVDSDSAAKVVLNDYRINAMEVAVDEECTQIIARRQPTASDLRLVMAVVKTITDLERMGDEIKRMSRFVMQLTSAHFRPGQLVEVEQLGKHVLEMLRNTMDAYARMDVEAALDVAREDVKVDQEYEAIMRQMMTYMMEDPRMIPATMDIIWCARALERIGDRCCNICEYIIYLVKGKDVRHTTLEDMEREARQS